MNYTSNMNKYATVKLHKDQAAEDGIFAAPAPVRQKNGPPRKGRAVSCFGVWLA